MAPQSGSSGGPGGRPGGGSGGPGQSTSNLQPSSPLIGTSSDSAGVTGISNTGPGVSGQSLGLIVSGGNEAVDQTLDKLAGDGVFGEGNNGVHGVSSAANGVLGENSGKGCGVTGTSSAGTGVAGAADTTDALYGYSVSGRGVHGFVGVGGFQPSVVRQVGPQPKNGCGVFGESDVWTGVFGASEYQHGVHGINGEASNGITPTFGCGVWGDSQDGFGVFGASKTADGMYGVHGGNSNSQPKLASGVRGESQKGYGVYGASEDATGVYGTSGKGGLAAEFVGTVKISGDLTQQGNSVISGTITAADLLLSGKDCAEDFDVVDAGQIEPGSVVVFDNEGMISQASQPYCKRVAGVVSGAGKYRPGVILGRVGPSDQGKAPVALMGRVYCKVDASYSPIEVGDLLTTSATPGCAMKATNPTQAFGAVIGKALAALNDGCSLIPILVALQ